MKRNLASPRNTLSIFMFLVIASCVVFAIFHPKLINLLAYYLSPDRHLADATHLKLEGGYYIGAAVLLALGGLAWKAQNPAWTARLRTVFLAEGWEAIRRTLPAPKFTLVFTTALGLLLCANMAVWQGHPLEFEFFYAKDRGALDQMVPALMLASSILLLLTLVRLGRGVLKPASRWVLSAFYGVCAVGLFLYAGEEVNWGQVYFHWRTPEAFTGNLENETNLHNYFNNYFDYFYLGLAVVLLIVLAAAWLQFNRRLPYFSSLALPHPSLIGLSLLVALVAVFFTQEQELLEEMMALFVLFYSLRVFNLFRLNPQIMEK